jgi:hypothetical protein
MSNENKIVGEGKAAWNGIRKAATLEAWIKVGHALLVGRRASMSQVGIERPHGFLYVQANSVWLRENGFSDIPKQTRVAVMHIAENEPAIKAWLGALQPNEGRPTHPIEVMNRWRVVRTGKPIPKRLPRVTEEVALQAWERALGAAKRAARCQFIAAHVVELIARATFTNTLASFEIAVPQKLARDFKPMNGHANGAVARPVNTVNIDEVEALAPDIN